jgi:hypothetical protein
MHSTRLKLLRAMTGAGLLATALLSAAAPATKMVTRDQLRACMNSESDLKARREAIEARNERDKVQAAAIRAEGEALKEQRTGAQQAASAAKQGFNARVQEYNAHIAAARTESESLRAEVEALNQAATEHNERCGGISYRRQDKEAILKEQSQRK